MHTQCCLVAVKICVFFKGICHTLINSPIYKGPVVSLICSAEVICVSVTEQFITVNLYGMFSEDNCLFYVTPFGLVDLSNYTASHRRNYFYSHLWDNFKSHDF